MVNNKSLYDILEVDKDVSSEDIKKQYRKLAKKYHPDRNPNNKEESEVKFKKLSKAYTVLSDPKQRKQYDILGEDGLNGSGNMPDPFDIFSSMFGGNHFNPFGNTNNMKRGPRKSETKQVKLNIPLEDLYVGKKLNLDYVRKNKCTECNGKGVEGENSYINCSSCDGKGNISTLKKMGPFIQHVTQICNNCRGKGKSIKPGCECKNCKGTKIMKEKVNIEVYINPGTYNGEKLVFENKADWNPECDLPGDFVIVICETLSKKCIFNRASDNLIIHRKISVKDALIGFKFRIKHLDGRIIQIEQNNIQNPDQIMCVKGEGMPKGKNEVGYGDLIIKFNIIFPNNLDDQRKTYLAKILPDIKTNKVDDELNNKNINDVEINKMNVYDMVSENNDKSQYDENVNEFNEEKVECNTQ